MQKKKQTKSIILITIIVIILLLIMFSEDIIKLQNNKLNEMPNIAKAQYTTTIGENIFDITNAVTDTPNAPTISAGMIPIKWDGNYWTITTKEDNTWYDYSNNQPAYIMLNDGTYQSELIRDMEGKKLAEKNIGAQIQEDELGTIYMWLPRFAYNEQGEILHIKQGYSVAGTWTMPEIFTYETEQKDISLAGVWIEYNPLSSTSEVTTKINNMNKEESIYGFIANTKPIAITENDITTIQKYTHINTLENITNTKRIILKITNSSQLEPIKAKAYYDETEEKIKIEVIDKTNEIVKILDKNGNILSENSTTADTGEEVIGNKVYKFIIIDNLGNQKQVTTSVSGLDVYIIENEEDLKLFRNAVNNGKTTTKTIAYQIADVKLNEGNYTIDEETKEIVFNEETAEQWTPIGSSKYYYGKYYGNNHTISGIYINTTSSYQGLFGQIDGCYIQDLKLNNSSIKGKTYVGGIVGYGKNSSIVNCSNEGNIEASERFIGGIVGEFYSTDNNSCIIEKCCNIGKITSKQYAGGIVGKSNKLIIYECYNLGKITSNDEVGGIIGRAEGDWKDTTKACKISKSYNSGEIISNGDNVGGIVGMLEYYSTLYNCYNTGTIKAEDTCGGIVGYNNKSIIYNCYNVGDISCAGGGYSSNSGIGGICGTNRYGTINKCYNKGSVQGNRFIGGIVGANGYSYSETTYSYVNNCVNVTEDITGTSFVGAICGENASATYSQVNSANYLKNTSSLNGIGLTRASSEGEMVYTGWRLNLGCTAHSDIESMPSIMSVINEDNAFVEDTEGINNGYPILVWQIED